MSGASEHGATTGDAAAEKLAETDRRALYLLGRGEASLAGRLSVNPDAQPVALLPSRVRAGEDMLQTLGLVPEGEPGIAPRRGLILVRSPAATRLTVVFSGNTPYFSMPAPLVGLPDTHTLLLRDPTRCFGFLGIPELGGTYDICLTNFERIRAALGVTETFFMGMSAGGSAAIKMGCDVRAHGILGFSVPTTLNLDDDDGAELRHYPQLARLYARARHLGIDLGKYYAAQLPRPRCLLVHSAAHVRDSWLAERMRDVSGVTLVDTIGFSGHATYQWLATTGRLAPLIDRLLSLKPLSHEGSSRLDGQVQTPVMDFP